MFVHELKDEAGGVAAANNGGGVFFLAEEFGNDGGSGGVGGIFGVAEEAVPNDGVCVGYEICDFCGGNWADVEFFAGGIFVKIGGDVDFGII